jgi:hypothetical protein
MSSRDSQSHVLEDLLATLPPQAVRAAEVLSLAHWTDDSTAVDLVTRFTSANGTTVAAVAEVKRLPFVSPVGTSRWKLGSPEREVLEERFRGREPELAPKVDTYLADRLQLASTFVPNNSPTARQLKWQSIYHRIAVTPAAAFVELDSFVDRATSVRQLSDVHAAVRLTELRRPWLDDYEIEIAYVVGRSAYEFGDLTTAEDRFLRVWGSEADTHRRIVSGHLLGVIWSKRNHEPWWSKAEEVLDAAASLAQESGDRYGEGVILTTLGSLQLRIGGERRLRDAEQALRRSVELQVGGLGAGMALGALGAVLMRRGSRARLLEAENILRRSLAVLPSDQADSAVDRLANVLKRLGGETRLKEAEALLQQRLENEADPLARAITLNALAGVLMQRTDQSSLEKAEDAARRSVELGKELGHARHTAMALLTGSFVAEKSGNVSLAISRMEEVVQINQQLGLNRDVEESRGRLDRLRSKLRPA